MATLAISHGHRSETLSANGRDTRQGDIDRLAQTAIDRIA